MKAIPPFSLCFCCMIASCHSKPRVTEVPASFGGFERATVVPIDYKLSEVCCNRCNGFGPGVYTSIHSRSGGCTKKIDESDARCREKACGKLLCSPLVANSNRGTRTAGGGLVSCVCRFQVFR